MTEGSTRRGFVARAVDVGIPLLVLFAFGRLCLAERQGLLVDDAYIAFRYAENFASGHGLVWNPGERIEGYTNLLWVLALTPLSKLGVDLTTPAVLLSELFAAGSVWLLAGITRRAFPSAGTLRRLFPPLLLATNPSFANASTSGMESTCFGFLVLFATARLIDGRAEPSKRRAAALALAAACLVRPEGILVAAIALTVELCSLEGDLRTRVRTLAPVAAAAGLVVAAHVAFRLAYYGYPLPNTFYAKVILGHTTLLRGTVHIAGFVIAGGFLTLPGVLEIERDTPARPYVLHGYSLLGAYAAYLFLIGGDYPFWYRFWVPLLPLPLLASTETAARALRALAGDRFARMPGALRRAVSGSLAAVFTLATTAFDFGFSEHSGFVGRIPPDIHAALDSAVAFFRKEAPERSVVAAYAVGQVGYYNPSLYILDMWGLNDAHIAHLDMPATMIFGHDKSDIRYILARKPDYLYLLVFPEAPPIATPGYEPCWPSAHFPVSVLRRTFPIADADASAILRGGARRYLAPPPVCRPPK